MKTRILAFLLVFCMLLGVLSGCNKDASDPSTPSTDGDGKTPASQTSDAASQTSAKYVYTADYMPLMLDAQVSYISPLCVSGNYLYFSADVTTSGGGIIMPGVSGGEVSASDAAAGIAPLSADDAVEAAAEDVPASEDPEPDAIIDDPVDEPVTDEPVIDVPTDGGAESYTSETRLYRVDLTTSTVEQMPGYSASEIPEGFTGYNSINYVLSGSDGSIWIYDTMSSYMIAGDGGEDYDGVHYDSGDYVEGPSVYRLQQLAADGTVLKTVDMSTEDGSYSSKQFQFLDSADHLYFTDWQTNQITIEDVDGKVLKSIDCSENNGWLTTFCDQAALQTYDSESNEQQLCVIDPETLELGDPIETPANGWSFTTSYDEAYDFYYESNNDLYGYKQKEQVSELVVSWMDCDVDPSTVYAMYPLEDGRILGLLNENGGGAIMYSTANAAARDAGAAMESGYTLVFLTKTDASNVKPKTVLTLACMYTDWDLRSRVVEFNKNNEDYRIIIKDYSQYATNDDNNAGLTKLNTEILSGQIPDLLYTYGMPISQYAVQGILTDLRPYIDADSELNGDQLMTHILDAASVDGKLYQAFSSFSISTAIGLSKVVGDYDEWTLTEVKDALSKLQPGATVFNFDMTRSQMLTNCLYRSYASFVDWENGTCNFDGEDFRELLEFVNSFPESFNYDDVDWSNVKYDAEALFAGEQLLTDTGIYSLDSYAWTLAAYGGESFRYVGYPSATGNNNVFNLGDGLCITNSCKDKDGAWQFVRKLFTKEYQEENSWSGLPTNAALFNEQIQKLMTIEYQTDSDGNYILDDNGEKVVNPKATYWIDDNNTYEIDVLTQEQIDQIMELYNSTSLVSQNDESITDIINEETAGYFAGQKTLDDTVRLIQNRVSLYVAEQK